MEDPRVKKVDKLKEELQELFDGTLVGTAYHEEHKRIVDSMWKLIGQRLTITFAEQLADQSMYICLTQARAHLDARVQAFRKAGKLTRIEAGPYSCKMGWIRAVVMVNGTRYGWYSYTGKRWTTGDNLDKQAEASYIRRRWLGATEVTVERKHILAQSWNEAPQGFRFQEGRIMGNRLYVTPYTSVPWEDIREGAEVRIGCYVVRSPACT